MDAHPFVRLRDSQFRYWSYQRFQGALIWPCPQSFASAPSLQALILLLSPGVDKNEERLLLGLLLRVSSFYPLLTFLTLAGWVGLGGNIFCDCVLSREGWLVSMKRGRNSAIESTTRQKLWRRVSFEDAPTNTPIASMRQRLSERMANLSQDMESLLEYMGTVEQELWDTYDAKASELEKERSLFEASRQRAQDYAGVPFVNLNVGGRMFSVTLEMMLKHPNSYFGALFSGRWEGKRGPDGSIFINRSGTLFHHIADYLRSDSLEVELSASELKALFAEADFYCLEGLMDDLKPKQNSGVSDWDDRLSSLLYDASSSGASPASPRWEPASPAYCPRPLSPAQAPISPPHSYL